MVRDKRQEKKPSKWIFHFGKREQMFLLNRNFPLTQRLITKETIFFPQPINLVAEPAEGQSPFNLFQSHARAHRKPISHQSLPINLISVLL